MKNLFTSLAGELTKYATFLAMMNDEYAIAIERTRNSFEWMFKTQFANYDKNDKEYQDFAKAFLFSYEIICNAKHSTSEMCEALRISPSVERSYNQAKDIAVFQLDRLIGNLEQTIAMFSRGKEILNI